MTIETPRAATPSGYLTMPAYGLFIVPSVSAIPAKIGCVASATVSLMSPVVSGMVLPVLKPRRLFLER